MNKNDLLSRIDRFYSSLADKGAEPVQLFMQQLYESYVESEHNANRQTITFIIATILVYALGAGLVNEMEISSFKVSKISLLTLFGPPVLGFLSYSMASSVFASVNLGAALRRSYKYFLPEAYAEDLYALIGPSTFMRVERMNKRDEHLIVHGLRVAVMSIVVLLGIAGTLLAIAYASYIVWNAGAVPWYVAVLSICIGGLAWARGLVLWLYVAFY